jgi:hypothetical protein
MIDEKRLIESSTWYPDILFKEEPTWKDGWNNCNIDWMKRIDELPKAGEWIPVSEMLPDEDNPVFIALAWESVDIGWYRNGEWFSEFCNYDPDYGVIAWMPLPAPFKESED